MDLLSRSFLGEPTVEPTEPSLAAASFDLWNQEPLWIDPTTDIEQKTPNQQKPETAMQLSQKLAKELNNSLTPYSNKRNRKNSTST